MNRLQQLAAQAAINGMMTGKTFYVSKVTEVAKALGIEHRCGGRNFEALRAVHCMDWADMTPELRSLVREQVMEILTIDEVLEMYTPSTLPRAYDPQDGMSVRRLLAKIGGSS